MAIQGYRIRLFVGPCGVGEIAAKIRSAGFEVDREGEKHVHYRAPYVDGWGTLSACDAVAEKVGIDWIGFQHLHNFIDTY